MTYEMVFGAGDSGKWEIILMRGAEGDVIGVVENFSQKG